MNMNIPIGQKLSFGIWGDAKLMSMTPDPAQSNV
jgi:hypothetical protein